jgi:FKBP-type peptidyl-prolyl cis-trans isomerase
MNKSLVYNLLFILVLLCIACKNNPPKESADPNDINVKKHMEEVNKILIKKDQLYIKGYISRQGWDMKETQTGLWYQILQEGSGKQAETGLVARINYSIRTIDGTLCYSSDEKGPKTFLIGQGNVESGLEQGILMMKEGTKARFIMPPHLAYGLIGDGERIPARAIIVYEVELISLSNE